MTPPPPHRRVSSMALVALGGAVGALSRAAIATVVHAPWATFVANVIGAFALGALLEWCTRAGDRPVVRLLLGTGFCGAFTTYSTFAREITEHAPGSGAALAAVEITLGIGAAALGAWSSARLTPRRSVR